MSIDGDTAPPPRADRDDGADQTGAQWFVAEHDDLLHGPMRRRSGSGRLSVNGVASRRAKGAEAEWADCSQRRVTASYRSYRLDLTGGS